MTQFSLDWPHGWKTRDGSSSFTHIVGKRFDGSLVFEAVDGGLFTRGPDGKFRFGGSCAFDIINAPAPKPEPRKWWVVAYRMACVDTAVTTSYNNEKDARKLMERHDVVPLAFTCVTEGDGLEGDK